MNRRLSGEAQLGAALRSGLVVWRALRDSAGYVHRAIGPWRAACQGENKTLTPTDEPVNCGHWACRTVK